jgi:hypothetical protein
LKDRIAAQAGQRGRWCAATSTPRIPSWTWPDTFRLFTAGPGHYTWWDLKTGARARNLGWRIDYFFVSDELRARVRAATILASRGGLGPLPDHADAGVGADPTPHPALSPEGRGEKSAASRARSKKLGYLEQRELDAMEAAIGTAETAVETCRRAAEDPGIASDPAALQARYAALEAARAEVDRLYARWAELEDKGETR